MQIKIRVLLALAMLSKNLGTSTAHLLYVGPGSTAALRITMGRYIPKLAFGTANHCTCRAWRSEERLPFSKGHHHLSNMSDEILLSCLRGINTTCLVSLVFGIIFSSLADVLCLRIVQPRVSRVP